MQWLTVKTAIHQYWIVLCHKRCFPTATIAVDLCLVAMNRDIHSSAEMHIHCVYTMYAFNECKSKCGLVSPPQEVDCNVHHDSDQIECVTHLVKDGCHV